MICGFMKPWAEGILVRIDNMAFRARTACRGLLLAGQFPKMWLPLSINWLCWRRGFQNIHTLPNGAAADIVYSH